MAPEHGPAGRRARPTPPRAALSTAWLAIKLGVEPRALDARRRAGELLGVRAGKSTDFVYPMWQFDAGGHPFPGLARVIAAARAAGLSDEQLHELLVRRQGMTGSGRLVDALREGRDDRVVEAIRVASARR